MSKISEHDLRAMQQRTARAIDPKAAQAKDAEKLEKFAAGQERELSRLFCADLTRRGVPFICARTDRKSTISDGWPDVTAMWGNARPMMSERGPRVCCVELKAAGGRLSAAQEACHAHLRAAGIPVVIAYSLADAIAFVKEHLRL